MKNYSGKLIIIISLFITFNIWLFGKQDITTIVGNPLLAFSQIFGLWGLLFMSFSLILSTRVHFVEELFGGLDKVYDIHKWIGSLGFVFALNHPMLLAIKALPSLETAIMYVAPGSDLAYNLGVFAIYTMLASFVFMVFVKLQYQAWLFTHKFLGVSFILAGLHALTIGSDISNNTLLKAWTLLFILLGTQSFIYTLFFYKKFGPRFIYKIDKVQRLLDIVNLYLTPVHKKMKYKSGQFAYLSLVSSRLGGESHPFTLSSSPLENELRLSVKILGDYTMNLRDLSKGSLACVYGPYGKFGEPYYSKKTPRLIWVAGGIGVTPFLSMLREENQNPSGKEIHFYYTCKTFDEAVFNEEIQQLVANLTKVTYKLWVTETDKHVNAHEVMQTVQSESGQTDDNTFVQICGPIKMMESMRDQFINEGIKESNIYFENFSML